MNISHFLNIGDVRVFDASIALVLGLQFLVASAKAFKYLRILNAHDLGSMVFLLAKLIEFVESSSGFLFNHDWDKHFTFFVA